jgi:uncharacterized membrane protein YraQ (UPF0718 family)
MELTRLFAGAVIELWFEVAPYLLLGMLFAGIVHEYLGRAFIYRHLGRGGLWSVAKATLMGIPLPVCSCGVIPLARALQNHGAHNSSVLSFLVATPTTGIDSILATYSLMGPLYAVFRPLAALLAGIILGGVDWFFEGHKSISVKEEVPEQSSERPHGVRLKDMLEYSFVTVPGDIGRSMIIGTLLGGLITALVPGTMLSRYVSFPWDFLVALVVGIPVYVCSAGAIPIAASLVIKGFSPGAGLVFLVAGPAANTLTLAFIKSRFGTRSLLLFVASISIVAVVTGLLFNYVWERFSLNTTMVVGGGEMLPAPIKFVSGAILLVLIIFSFTRKKTCMSLSD